MAQINADEMVSMRLHLNVKGADKSSSYAKNIQDQEALRFDVPAFIANNEDKALRIFGSRKNVQDIVNYQFDSGKLDQENNCDTYCEKIVSIERLPFIGVGIEPMPDFSGVIIDRIVEDAPAEDSELEIGDIITAIQDIDISTSCELTGTVNDQEVEDYVAVDYIRDGKPQRTFLTIGYRVKKNVTWVKCCAEEINAPVVAGSDLSLSVFPNPTPGITQFNFYTTEISAAHLQLTDMAGRTLLSKKVFPMDGFLNDYLDLSKIPSGIYLLNIEQDGKTVSEKIVLQRK